MKAVMTILPLLLFKLSLFGQHIDVHVREGNKLFRQGKYDLAVAEYRKSLQKNSDPSAAYNLGNALFRAKNYDEAVKTYDRILSVNKDKQMRQKLFYNKGVSLSKQNKLEESIEAYKNAVLLDPSDQDARVNLQKALLELRKRQPKEQPKKQNDNKKQQNKQNQPPPQNNNLSRKQVEQLLKALQQREQQVQQRMQQRHRTAGREEKDW
jgi:tetratricopeptide (TPR) repeat protein